MTRPAAEHPGDVVPSPDEFAGWPPLGALSADVSLGPIGVRLERMDSDVRDSLARWTALPGGAPPAAQRAWADLALRLELTRSERAAYLVMVPGARARLHCWREGAGLAMVTHGAALLMDDDAERGIVALARQLEPDLDQALQNVLRVAAAWRLARSGRGLLLHAAAVERGDEAIVLLGPSGAGKSTAARLSWPRPALADDVVVLTAPRTEDGRWLVHPTPLWADAAFPARTTRLSPLPVAGVLRLRHAASPRVEPLSRAAAAAALLAHAPFLGPLGPPASPPERLASAVPQGTLHFALDRDFWPAVDAWLEEAASRDAGRGLQ